MMEKYVEQNTLSLSSLLVSVCGFTAAGCLYFYAVIPVWCCIIIAALSGSKRFYCSRNRTRFNSSAILQINLRGVSFYNIYSVDY
jgi:hypothetical protein